MAVESSTEEGQVWARTYCFSLWATLCNHSSIFTKYTYYIDISIKKENNADSKKPWMDTSPPNLEDTL